MARRLDLAEQQLVREPGDLGIGLAPRGTCLEREDALVARHLVRRRQHSRQICWRSISVPGGQRRGAEVLGGDLI